MPTAFGTQGVSIGRQLSVVWAEELRRGSQPACLLRQDHRLRQAKRGRL